MHELGLCTDIVDAIERRAGDRAVAEVTVRVGRLHHVHPEAFDQSFAMAALGTIAEGATATLVLVPVRVRCSHCQAETQAEEMISAFERCGGVDLELTGGDELMLESLRYRPAGEPTLRPPTGARG